MKKINLKNVTLCAVSSVKIEETILALKKSMHNIDYARVILLTDKKINLDSEGIKVIEIEKLNYHDYSYFMLYKLKNYIETDFVLTVQHDGYVLRPNKWDDKFFNYDYIGAPWPKNMHYTQNGRNIRVGNGGFSFRSKKLLNILSDLNLPFQDLGTGFFHEDGVICGIYGDLLIENGIRFAPTKLASKFSRERWCLDSKIFTFGFHNKRKPFLKFLYNKLLQKLKF